MEPDRLLQFVDTIDELRKRLDEARDANACAALELKFTENENEQLRADAERYRFLRDNLLGLRVVDGSASYPPPRPDLLDSWLDDAIAAAAQVAT
jgi:hypothetical protein